MPCTTRSTFRHLLGWTAVALLLCAPSTAGAQAPTDIPCESVDDFPCGIQMESIRVQRVPNIFKFQARVAQAKLPIGEGNFKTVVVKVLRNTEVLCVEQKKDVQVRNSVLNLEIGREMSCDLDDVIAENANLKFQICLGGSNNCLKPIDLGTVPYAVKASFSTLSQRAHESNVSAQAHYAHRVTADRDLFVRKTLGTGYFDFYTPTADDRGSLFANDADFAAYADGGFIQWVPIRGADAGNKLHISGKAQASDDLRELAELVLGASHTITYGDVTVNPDSAIGLTVASNGAHITGNSDIDGTLTVTSATTINSGGMTVEAGGALVTGNSSITGTLLVSDMLTVQSNGANITGDSTINGTLTIDNTTTVQGGGLVVDTGGLTVSEGGAMITGDSSVAGTLLIGSSTTVQSGGLSVSGGATIATGALGVSEGNLSVDQGDLAVAGDSTLSGSVEVGTAADGSVAGSGSLTVHAGGATVTGDSKVAGTLTVDDISIEPPNGSGIQIRKDTDSATTVIDGEVEFLDRVVFTGGTMDTEERSAFDGRYVMRDDNTNIRLRKNLTVQGLIRLGPGLSTLGDPEAYIQSRRIPGGQDAGNERSELILMQPNDGTGTSGPDYITLRSPALRFQTYDNANVNTPSQDAGSNTRLEIAPDGHAFFAESVTIDGHLEVSGNVGLAGQLLAGQLAVDGAANIGGRVEASGNLETGAELKVSGNGEINRSLTVGGNLSVSGSVSAGSFNVSSVASSGAGSFPSLSVTKGVTAGSFTTSGKTTTNTLTTNGNAHIKGTLRIGTPSGDPAPYIMSRTVPGGQGNGNEKTELILFHSNDASNGAGNDLITLRSPEIRLQTYDNAVASNPTHDAGSNTRLTVAPAGRVTVHNGLTVQGGINGGGTLTLTTTDCQKVDTQETGYDGFKIICPTDRPIMRELHVDEDGDDIDGDDGFAQCCKLALSN